MKIINVQGESLSGGLYKVAMQRHLAHTDNNRYDDWNTIMQVLRLRRKEHPQNQHGFIYTFPLAFGT